MDAKRRIALYARVSSHQQATDATIQSQVAALKKRIADDGFRLDPELILKMMAKAARAFSAPP